MCTARSGSSPPPVRKLGEYKIWEGANGECNRRERLPLPLSRNATGISASPAMPRRSSRANGVVDFRLARAWPWRNCQTGRSSGACPRGALKLMVCKNATEPREPNGPINAGPMRAKGRTGYQTPL
jgi:hypothetical protein